MKIHFTLDELQELSAEELQGIFFFKTSASTIPFAMVKSLTASSIVLTDNTEVHTGRGNYSEIMQRYTCYQYVTAVLAGGSVDLLARQSFEDTMTATVSAAIDSIHSANQLAIQTMQQEVDNLSTKLQPNADKIQESLTSLIALVSDI